MEYVWIVILAIVYIDIWCNTLDGAKLRGAYWTPFTVGNWGKVDFYDVWIWLHELALIVLFIFSLVKFIQKWS